MPPDDERPPVWDLPPPGTPRDVRQEPQAPTGLVVWLSAELGLWFLVLLIGIVAGLVGILRP